MITLFQCLKDLAPAIYFKNSVKTIQKAKESSVKLQRMAAKLAGN